MEGFKFSPKSKKILMLLVILALTPFAPELLLFMDVAGVEVAFTCLLIMIKPMKLWVECQIVKIKEFSRVMILAVKQHPVSDARVFAGHYFAFSLTLLLTSSLFVSSSIWLPILVMGRYIA
ncbi:MULTISPECIES: hypothetical protein [unclassified Shewanella]|uniref:hypothetical protein n=1 Tax=unclassified Shewanella TaxID=196818 RepID=UPI000C8644B0|nr:MULTISPECIES: hypothetical protein [unclassified Shewanella]MDO6618795.1 hypothetical protein [Shewanella sp. 6_MG-2023]MDO6774346.1 hypothetical protein [Shewanella sp. 3_MG-2023]PMG29722.1 hypothetical protein BCU94_02930 [Shewanella sp. 10N.286.52.C2]PMG49819.1 hypothetical protein BCU91_18005 [Shewanella sp. 10N.286.52.B9]PMH88872.1 hypothetical protein BCU57_19330 [Shewanella sp. 10N.286.48.B5]